MALKHFATIFLLALLFSSLHDIEARDSLMFNKIPNKVNEDILFGEVNTLPVQYLHNPNQQKQQEDEQENSTPQNDENEYEVFSYEGYVSPSARTQKYLSNKYNNNVAYVTQPENSNTYTNTPPNNNNYQPQDNDNNYYNAEKKENKNDLDFMGTEDTSINANNINSHYDNEFVTKNKLNTGFMDASEANNNDDNNHNEDMDDVNYDINYGQYVRDKFGNSMHRNRFKPTGYNNVDNTVQYTTYKNEDNMH